MQFFKKVWKNIKKIKLKTLVLLILFLMMSTYAWFIYVDKVSGGIIAHVTAWHVTFKIDDEEVKDLAISVGQIYPGMEDYTEKITVINSGEMDGKITYDIKKMIILGEVYEVSSTVTTEDLKNMLENDFPFSIELKVSGEEDNTIPVGENKDVTISLVWPLDGDDDRDTIWGENAYEFYKENGPDATSVRIELQLKVDQK